VLNLVYPLPPSSIHPAGFGYLVPRSPTALNPEGILGVIFDSTAVPGNDDPRVEGRVTKLTMMMGGPWWSTYPASEGKIVSAPTDPQDLIQPAMEHLHRVFPMLEGVKPLIMVPQLQTDCIPTYGVGHAERLRELHHFMAADEGGVQGRVSLVGNGYGGVGVNDCVLSAEEVVRGLARGDRPTGLERWMA
jgi:oxygen-dependent protoporphyrinogen oxidase